MRNLSDTERELWLAAIEKFYGLRLRYAGDVHADNRGYVMAGSEYVATLDRSELASNFPEHATDWTKSIGAFTAQGDVATLIEYQRKAGHRATEYELEAAYALALEGIACGATKGETLRAIRDRWSALTQDEANEAARQAKRDAHATGLDDEDIDESWFRSHPVPSAEDVNP